jgi:hypothetical protein
MPSQSLWQQVYPAHFRKSKLTKIFPTFSSIIFLFMRSVVVVGFKIKAFTPHLHCEKGIRWRMEHGLCSRMLHPLRCCYFNLVIFSCNKGPLITLCGLPSRSIPWLQNLNNKERSQTVSPLDYFSIHVEIYVRTSGISPFFPTQRCWFISTLDKLIFVQIFFQTAMKLLHHLSHCSIDFHFFCSHNSIEDSKTMQLRRIGLYLHAGQRRG